VAATALAWLVAAGAVPPALAGDDAPEGEPQTQEDKVEDIDQRLKTLERKAEVDAERAAAAAPNATVVTASLKDGFSIRSADGAFLFKVRGYVQMDGRFYDNDVERNTVDTFILRRVRPVFEATLGRIYDFKIMPDFGQGTTTLFDAYVEARFNPLFKVRAGKYKPPVGLERLQSATDIVFAERALPTNLVPNRDLGFQISGDTADGVLSYQGGIFNGVPDGANADVDSNDSKEGAARVFLHPFKRTAGVLQGLGIGLAGSYGTVRGATATPQLPVYRTTGQQIFFNYAAGTFADGTHSRIAPQAYYSVGRFGLLTEYVISRQEVENAVAHTDLEHTAWGATATFMITKDKAAYKSVAPVKSLGPDGIGGIELKARFSSLEVDPDTFPTFASVTTSAQQADAVGLGINWYLTRNVKAVLDYEQTKFKGGRATGERENERVFFSRVQLQF